MGAISLCLVSCMSHTQPICLVAQFNKPVIFSPNRGGRFLEEPLEGVVRPACQEEPPGAVNCSPQQNMTV